jgi:hypothetical protein
MRSWFALTMSAFSIALVASCKRPTPDVLLDCTFLGFADIETHDVIRISPGTRQAQDLAFSPARSGTAQISEADYVVELIYSPQFKLRFRINRLTGEGSREFVDKGGAVAPTDYNAMKCRPYAGKPF